MNLKNKEYELNYDEIVEKTPNDYDLHTMPRVIECEESKYETPKEEKSK